MTIQPATGRGMLLPRRVVLGAALAAPLAAPLAGRAAPVLNIGDQRGGIEPLMAAAGVLSGAPYSVSWSQFAGAPMLLEALNAGAIDAGGIGDAPFASAIAASIPMKAVSVTRADGAVTALVVPRDSPITDITGLRGRKIATLRGQTGHFLVLAALNRAGMEPGEVHFVFIEPSAAKAALAAGAVDAWATWGPYISLAKINDGAREIVNGHTLMSGQSYTVATNAAIASKRTVLADFLRRLRLAREWGTAHPEEQARVWAEQTNFPLPVGLDVVRTANTRTVPINAFVMAEQQRVADFFQAARVIPTGQVVADFFDPSFNQDVFA